VRDQFGAQEETRTQFVMLRGAVIAMKSNVRVGHKVSIRNGNGQTAECHVIAMEPVLQQVHQVEIEFTAPQTNFWPVQFPAEESARPDLHPNQDLDPRVAESSHVQAPEVANGRKSQSKSDLHADPVLELHRLSVASDSGSYSSNEVSELAKKHDQEIVVLAGQMSEEFSSGHVTKQRPAITGRNLPLDSVAQFRAANREAHRRERQMKVVCSILTVAALAGFVLGAKNWMGTRVTATTPLTMVATPVTASALPKPEPGVLAVSPAIPIATEAAATVSENTGGSPEVTLNPYTSSSPETIVIEEATHPGTETQVQVRHGSSVAASLPKRDAEEEPVAFPLRAAVDTQKPEMLSAVAQSPTKVATLAPQPVRRETPAKLLHSVPPQYPQVARQMRLQGVVVLDLQIDNAGSVKGAKVVSGSPLLTAAAIDATRRWHFQPATLGDRAVPSTETVKVSFNLK